jgi:lysophospholipase L1-like esterase
VGAAVLMAVGLAGGAFALYRWLQYQSDRRPANAPDRMAAAVDVYDQPVVVCLGDSLTQGRMSSDYVALLQRRFRPKGYRFVNAGINGELAYNVLQRLDAVIACRPSWITIMVGTNDAYAALSTANAHETMDQMGLPERPTRETFRRYLTEVCLQLRNATPAPLALLSLPPLGEDPAHPAFQTTGTYSRIIQTVARETGNVYLPIHERMCAFLENQDAAAGRSFDDYKDGIGLAVKIRRFLLHQSFETISRRNGFALLTDFFHLNDAGAAIVADAVTEFITSGAPHDSIGAPRRRGLQDP